MSSPLAVDGQGVIISEMLCVLAVIIDLEKHVK